MIMSKAERERERVEHVETLEMKFKRDLVNDHETSQGVAHKVEALKTLGCLFVFGITITWAAMLIMIQRGDKDSVSSFRSKTMMATLAANRRGPK